MQILSGCGFAGRKGCGSLPAVQLETGEPFCMIPLGIGKLDQQRRHVNGITMFHPFH